MWCVLLAVCRRACSALVAVLVTTLMSRYSVGSDLCGTVASALVKLRAVPPQKNRFVPSDYEDIYMWPLLPWVGSFACPFVSSWPVGISFLSVPPLPPPLSLCYLLFPLRPLSLTLIRTPNKKSQHRKWTLCHCDNTRVERTPNKSQHRKLTLESKILLVSRFDIIMPTSFFPGE